MEEGGKRNEGEEENKKIQKVEKKEEKKTTNKTKKKKENLPKISSCCFHGSNFSPFACCKIKLFTCT